MNGSQVCPACLPPACPAGLHPASSIALGAGSPPRPPPPPPPLPLFLLLTNLCLCLLPLSTPFRDSLSSSPPSSPGGHSTQTEAPLGKGVDSIPAPIGTPSATTWGCVAPKQAGGLGHGGRTWTWPAVSVPLHPLSPRCFLPKREYGGLGATSTSIFPIPLPIQEGHLQPHLALPLVRGPRKHLHAPSSLYR